MLELVEANWIAFLAVLLLGLLVAWWIWGRQPAPRVRAETPDVLTPGAAPAERNTLLVDAPPASAAVATAPIAGVAPDIMAGLGEVFAAAAAQEIDEAAAHDQAAAKLERPAASESIATQKTVFDPELAKQTRAAQPTVFDPALATGDDLTRIKGVGPKLDALLKHLGVSRYEQIAGWSEEDAARIDAQLGPFQGRIARDAWIEQCRYLAAGDVAGFEARFGKV